MPRPSSCAARPPLERDAAYHLLLLLHELCTNALKHGALSTDTGQVTIRWNQAGVIDWQETGGPSVRPPDRQGWARVCSRASSIG
jgi:two-component sensor histidine kinase